MSSWCDEYLADFYLTQDAIWQADSLYLKYLEIRLIFRRLDLNDRGKLSWNVSAVTFTPSQGHVQGLNACTCLQVAAEMRFTTESFLVVDGEGRC